MNHNDDKITYSTVALYFIFGALIVVIIILLNIARTLNDIADATQYTSASADYLKDVKNTLEEIRDK